MELVDKRKALFADFALLIVALIWGGGFIAAKVALTSLTPMYLLAIRFLGSGLILLIIFFKKFISIDRKSILAGVLLGVLLFFGYIFQTVGLLYTSAGKQAFLVASYTILVPFISWAIVKKKPKFMSIVAGFLTLIGIGLLSLQQSFTLSYGDSLTLLFAVTFALQIVLVGVYAKSINPIHITTIQLLSAGILALLSALTFETGIHSISNESIIGMLYLVIFNTTIAFLVQNIAQKYTSDSHTSIIISLEALFGALLSVLIMGDIFTIKMVVGCALILFSVIVSKLKG